MKNVDGALKPTELLSNIWNDISWEGIANEGQITLKKGKKPERLLRRIIEIATQPDDIVLDFFAGSGTTLAVAQKMGRRYIGVEQMDYIENITLSRLKKVIEGEQGGVSKLCNWQGGGGLVYMELAKANEQQRLKIMAAETAGELWACWEEIKSSSFLSYKVKISAFDANKASFEELELEQQRLFLCELLDKNMLYVPYCDMESAEFGLSEAELAFSHDFYNQKI